MLHKISDIGYFIKDILKKGDSERDKLLSEFISR